jgi:hypothetical protein
VAVNLHGKRATDEHLRLLRRFPDLENLVLTRTLISDAGMTHLASLSKLKWLELESVDVGDDGVRKLRELRELIVLRLTGTRVSLAGIADIAPLAATLEELWIGRTVMDYDQVRTVKQNWPQTKVVLSRVSLPLQIER